jgi:purine nucleosidase
VEIVGITTVAGNVSVEQGTRNALYTAELCGSHVPVFTGATSPLTRTLQRADWFHGKDGLGDHGYSSSWLKEKESAIEALVRLIAEHPAVEILTLGPLTNLALALLLQPDLVCNVSRCVVMGGAPCCEGNVTPAAEYNFWVDPEAARIVCRSQLPIELVGWQLSRGAAVINASEIEALLALKTALAEFAIRSNDAAAAAYHRQTGERGIALPDPIAMAVFLNPALIASASSHYLDVQIDDGLTRGMSVVDRLDVAQDERNQQTWSEVIRAGRKQSVIWAIDIAGWKQALFAALD